MKSVELQHGMEDRLMTRDEVIDLLGISGLDDILIDNIHKLVFFGCKNKINHRFVFLHELISLMGIDKV